MRNRLRKKERKLFEIVLILACATLAACTSDADDADSDAGESPTGTGGSGGDGGGGSDGGNGEDGGGGSDGGNGGDGGGDDAPPQGDLIACATRDRASATVLDSRVDGDATWSGVIYVQSDLDVTDDATITIEPGTDIVVAADRSIEFGAFGSTVTVMAEGTEDDPIRICGEGAEPGYWGTIQFAANVTSNSVLSHVLISDGGGDGPALDVDMALSVQNVQIRNFADSGFDAAAFADDSGLLSVEGGTGITGLLSGAAAATNFPLGGLLANNEDNFVEVDMSRIDVDTTFHDIGVPYHQDGSLDVTDDAELTYEAGVEYRFGADASLSIGAFGSEVTLFANGTESEPVVFRGSFEEAGHWEGIDIESNVRSNSVMANVVIMHGGGQDTPVLQIRAPITLGSVSLDANSTGARILAQGLAAGSANLSITGTGGAPLDVDPNALVSLPEGGDFTGNDDDHIILRGGRFEVAGTVPNLGVPYLVDGAIDTVGDSSMTISAGTHFIMTADTSIEFGAFGGASTLVVEGTAAAPVKFTPLDDIQGYWDGLVVQGNVLSNSSLDYVEVSYGGSAGACLDLRAEIPVSNSTFSNCAGYGLRHDGDFTTDYSSTNTFADNESGAIETF